MSYFRFCILMVFCAVPFQSTLAQSDTSTKDLLVASTKQYGVSISVALKKRNNAGDPVLLTCLIENRSAEPIDYFEPSLTHLVDIKIVDSLKKDIPLTRFGRKLKPRFLIPQGVLKEVLPGKKEVVYIPLGQIYDITVADTYAMVVGFRFNVGLDRTIHIDLKEIHFEIQSPVGTNNRKR